VVRVNPASQGKLISRHAEEPVTEALTDTRVVLVTGARQSGKSTLVGVVAKGRKAEWRNLDTATARQAAIADPAGFVDSGELMVIDEIQRAPELLLAIKERAHRRDAGPDPPPGGPLRSALGRQRGRQRRPAPRQYRASVPRLAGRGLPDQADPRLVAQRQRACRRDSQAGFRRFWIAANLLGADVRTLLRPGGPFGPLLEGFVLMELARQITWSQQRAELFHYRTKDKVEVDAVLENRQGHVIGIEIKASSTVAAGDFRGLRHLAERIGSDFITGIVFYTGGQTLPFGPRLRAVPVSALWQA